MSPTVDTEREQIERLAAGDPDKGPILMLNLLRFRDRAATVDGEEGLTGRLSSRGRVADGRAG